MKKRAAISLYDRARERSRLWEAWEVVQHNAKRSGSNKTKQEAETFRRNQRLNLEKVARSLQKKSFRFKPQRAVAIPKDDGVTKRPLIVAPIDNRIVQRALLETLQEIPAIRTRLHSGFNFGGVENKGVPDAVLKVAKHARALPFFVRTDVKGFFQNVRREDALASLLTGIEERDFIDIVRAAVETELDDATKYLADTGIFPIYDEGVAQGSCLSPLLCNVLLHPFDEEMNTRGIVTIRYIDDFILLAKSERAARRAFEAAQRWLTLRGLGCYDPLNPEHAKKAEQGNLENGATFLGCDVTTISIRPSRENFRGLQNKIHEGLRSSIAAFKSPMKAQMDHKTFAETLVWASSTIRGWGNTFGFCSDDRLFRDIDATIGELLSEYELRFQQARGRMSAADARRAIGVFLLDDRKRNRLNEG